MKRKVVKGWAVMKNNGTLKDIRLREYMAIRQGQILGGCFTAPCYVEIKYELPRKARKRG